MAPDRWAERARELTEQLVAIPSVNGTEGEAVFAAALRDLLLKSPAFQGHPDRVRLLPVPGDPKGRSNVVAWLPGGPRTVLLTGHFDVVTTSNLGALEPLAFRPSALAAAASDLLRREAAGGQADPLAERDLASGSWMLGRGALDMKSGLAGGLAVLERAAAEPVGGSLLLVATPDEEATSAGMRAAVPQIRDLARQWDLEPVAAFNLDITEDQGDGARGRAVFLGSVGKLLPFVFLVGREVHAGMPPVGLNAALLAAEVTRHVELAPDLVDEGGGEVAPAPVTLHQTDGRQGYDVTTPRTAWCYYNLLRHRGSAAPAFDAFCEVVRAAVDEAAALTHQRATVQVRREGGNEVPARFTVPVLTYAELRARVDRLGGGAVAACDAAGADAPDLPELARRVTAALWEASGLRGPAAIVGLAGVPYAPVALGEETERGRRLLRVVQRQAAAAEAELGAPVVLRGHFPGISDMSFFAGGEAESDDALFAANTPGWGTAIRVDAAAARELAVPIVNVGPWGRDAHGRLERVHAPYAFGTFPELLFRLVGDVLADG